MSKTNPYKEMAFDAFIEIIGDGPIESWGLVATALGVDARTIYRWRQHPEAKKAIAKALIEALKGMKKSGSDDWRMWREYMKILGIKDITTLEGDLNISAVIDRLESDYDEYSRKLGVETPGQSVENDTSVQDQGQAGQPGDVPTESSTEATPGTEAQPQA